MAWIARMTKADRQHGIGCDDDQTVSAAWLADLHRGRKDHLLIAEPLPWEVPVRVVDFKVHKPFSRAFGEKAS